MEQKNTLQELVNLVTQAFQQLETLCRRMSAAEEYLNELQKRVNGLAVGTSNGLAAAQPAIMQECPFLEVKEEEHGQHKDNPA